VGIRGLVARVVSGGAIFESGLAIDFPGRAAIDPTGRHLAWCVRDVAVRAAARRRSAWRGLAEAFRPVPPVAGTDEGVRRVAEVADRVMIASERRVSPGRDAEQPRRLMVQAFAPAVSPGTTAHPCRRPSSHTGTKPVPARLVPSRSDLQLLPPAGRRSGSLSSVIELTRRPRRASTCAGRERGEAGWVSRNQRILNKSEWVQPESPCGSDSQTR